MLVILWPLGCKNKSCLWWSARDDDGLFPPGLRSFLSS
jgi:hypothetical protein